MIFRLMRLNVRLVSFDVAFTVGQLNANSGSLQLLPQLLPINDNVSVVIQSALVQNFRFF